MKDKITYSTIFLYKFILHPDIIVYELEIRTEGHSSKGKITKEMYERMKGKYKEEKMAQGEYVEIK